MTIIDFSFSLEFCKVKQSLYLYEIKLISFRNSIFKTRYEKKNTKKFLQNKLTVPIRMLTCNRKLKIIVNKIETKLIT